MSAAIFETGSKATTTPVAPAVPRVFGCPMQAEQSIVVDPKSPGGINSPHGLILFDGVCVLCSRGCRFASKRDRRGYFRFVPIQLAEGRPLAEQLGIDPDHPDSFAFLASGQAYVKIRSRTAHCARSALAVDMGLLIHPTGDPRRDL
jgi:DCC1-like thiol-disulfide oxidoreductase